MIDVVVSYSMCPHCEIQRTIMEKSFFPNEYRIIEFGSKEFESFDLKANVDAVPFVVVRDDDNGAVKFARKGIMDGTSLRKIERTGTLNQDEGKVFNLREARFTQSHMLSSMDS